MLFNVLERQVYHFWGKHFMPQDFYLFVIAMLILYDFHCIVHGCFWKAVLWLGLPSDDIHGNGFRKIEYWIEGDANAQKRLNKAPWTCG